MPSELPETWSRILGRLGGTADEGATIGRRQADATPASELTPVPGQPFAILARLGRGGMGEVVRARQESVGREVAIKILGPLAPAGDREALRREARIAGRLEHPHIVPVHVAGDGFYAMRLVQGRSLAQALREEILPVEAVEALRKVAEAIAFAHTHGVIHRDIKPANIMLGDFGEVFLVDWGLALELERGDDGRWRCPPIDPEVAAAGTPAYLTPESARGDAAALGPATDVYLLGACLYMALTKRAPHGGNGVALAIVSATRNSWTPIAELNPDAPRALIALAERAMATEPAARPSAAEFRDALVAWLRSPYDEAEALRQLIAGREHLAGAEAAAEAGATYAACRHAERCFEKAAALSVDADEARDAIRQARELLVRRALEHGDLALAGVVAARAADERLGERVREARQRRDAVGRRTRRWRVAAACGLILATALGAGGGAWMHLAGARDRAERLAEGLRLAEEARSLAPRDADAHLARIERLWRASGLASEDGTVLAALREALRAGGLRAVEERRLDLAEALRDQLDAGVGDRTAALEVQARIDAARTDVDAARRAEIARRRTRLGAIVDATRSAAGLRQSDAVAEIAAWDGGELADDVTALARHADPRMARLAAAVLALRRDWRVGDALAAMLAHGDREVRDAAFAALARRDDPAAGAAVARRLLAEPERAAADGAALGPALRAAVVAAAPAQGAERASLLAACGELARAAETAEALGVETLAAIARAAFWRPEAREACAALTARLRERHPGEPWGALLAAELAGASDPAAALALLDQAGDAPLLLPLRCRLLRALARPAEHAQAADALALAEPLRLAGVLADAAQELDSAGRGPAARALARRIANRWLGRLQDARAALAEGRLRCARELALSVAADTHGHAEALEIAARAALRAGDAAAAATIARGAAARAPAHAGVLGAAALAGVAQGTWDAAYDAGLAAWGEGRRSWDGLAAAVAAQRLGARRPRPAPAIAGAWQPASLGRVWMLARAACEDGDHGAVVDQLAALRELAPAGDRDLRAIVDTLLLAAPALRRSGWPGMERQRLAGALLAEAMYAAETADTARLDELVAQARAHLGGDAALEAAADLLASAGRGEGGAALAALARFTAAPADRRAALPRLDRRAEALRAHLAGSGAPLPLPRPACVSERLRETWPGRPLRDLALDDARAARLRSWWADQAAALAPDADDLRAVEAWRAACASAGHARALDAVPLSPEARR